MRKKCVNVLKSLKIGTRCVKNKGKENTTTIPISDKEKKTVPDTWFLKTIICIVAIGDFDN